MFIPTYVTEPAVDIGRIGDMRNRRRAGEMRSNVARPVLIPPKAPVIKAANLDYLRRNR